MNSALLCSYCNRPISGKYFRDYWGNNYHSEHLNKVPQCNYCSRLISRDLTKGGTSYSDGRRICMLCHKSAIEDTVSGKRILQKVHDQLAVLGIDINPFRPEFYMLDRSRLKAMAGSTEKQGFARFQRETINGKMKSFTMEIYILKGLPETSFISAAAHELMHIWFYSRNLLDLTARLEEGSCNYAAYLILQGIHSPEAAYRIHELMKDNSPVYGKGFQKVYKMVQDKGIAYWLKYIQSHKK
ncbi:MAG: protein DA1 [Spirochaetaceae bacterium]|nr:protein DA1 [Spirochaetaceae bacterium]